MADGEISFSGRMGGYGWLIIVDHPQANLYSLYGHLSPSRWRLKSGTVEKGELVAYLGDPDENGGSAKHPLRSHLHFGVRAGRRSGYSGLGEARWQAGWIKPCPTDVGWLRPTAVINSQAIPAGGYPEPPVGFLSVWGLELLFTSMYVFGGACMLVFAIKQDKPFVLVMSGFVPLAAGWILRSKGAKMGYALFAMSVLYLAFGIYWSIRRLRDRRAATHGNSPQ
jgi:murein DD-endopeptidase MepM/ murein hydrolase activator NlpD